jgi:hypothetical protein
MMMRRLLLEQHPREDNVGDRRSTRTTASPKNAEEWIAQWIEDLHDWWDSTVMHHEPHKKEAAKGSSEDDWAAKEFQRNQSRGYEKTTTAVSSKIPKVQKTTYEWLTHDMTEAGKGEREGLDWVATDLKRAGQVGPLHENWVEEDMKEAGEAGMTSTTARIRKKPRSPHEPRTETDMISKGMREAGRGMGSAWIAQDMKEAGMAREKRSSYAPWTERLRDQLDAEREKRYDHVFHDMTKAGKQGSHASDWIEADMIRAGMAESVADHLKSAASDGSYKLEGWHKERYDPETVREHMETTGRAEEQDWISSDMTTTGQNRSMVGRSCPPPKKELREWLGTDETISIAQDMAAEGRASGDRRTRKEKITRSGLMELVAQDMQMVGTTSTNWVETDMERMGHAEPHLNREVMTKSHKQRETEEFVRSRKVKLAESAPNEADKWHEELESVNAQASATTPTVYVEEPFLAPKHDEMTGAALVASTPEPIKKHAFRNKLFRATKRVFMPWKAWEDIA